MDARPRIKPALTANARALRSNLTDAEVKVWQAIRGKQLLNYRFRRQHVIGDYIADFACIEKKLVIELDGGQHQDQLEDDERRTAFLVSRGWRVLRFWNNDVLNNLGRVLSTILDMLESDGENRPSPL